jgi:hypothetical protein
MAELDDLKYSIVERITSTKVFDSVYVRDEAKIRFVVENADAGNTVRIQGRLIGQTAWVQLLDITGTNNQVLDITTYEDIQVSVFAYASLTDHIMVIASSFDNVIGFSGNYNDLTNKPTIPAAITTKDEGITLTTDTTSVNFVGAGVTATNTAGAVTVTIPGGAGAGPTFLKPSVNAPHDFASIPGLLFLDYTITVPGAVVGDIAMLNAVEPPFSGVIMEAFVSAANTVIIRAHNVTNVAQDMPLMQWNVVVLSYASF